MMRRRAEHRKMDRRMENTSKYSCGTNKYTTHLFLALIEWVFCLTGKMRTFDFQHGYLFHNPVKRFLVFFLNIGEKK
jgi:hypothetical protein